MSIRKQAAESLTKLLKQFPNVEKIELAWLHYVMHLIVDREQTVQQFTSKLISVNL